MDFYDTTHFSQILNMKFNAIVGNPPYQEEDGGFRTSAHPIYDVFTRQSIALNADFISLVIPARWFAGGKGMESFREEMIHNKSLCELHDYPVAIDCFEGVQIKGGVCCFLLDSSYSGPCSVKTHLGNYSGSPLKRFLANEDVEIFIRYNESLSIIKKVKKYREQTMDFYVSRRIPFGLPTYFHGSKEKHDPNMIRIYENRGISYAFRDAVIKNKDVVDQYKVFIPRSSDGSDFIPHVILGIPFLGEPGSACSETFNFIGPFKSRKICENVMHYISTKFFRFMAMQMKSSQSATKKLYSFVPVQDFSIKWTDELLYEKYKLTKKEVEFIEAMIRPMDLNRQRKQRYWKDLQEEL